MIRDEDLLLYHYNDGLQAAERARISAALRTDPELNARLHLLLADIEAVASQSVVVAPAATRARWTARLNAAAAAEMRPGRSRRSTSWRSWALALAGCTSLTIGIGIGQRMQPQDTVVPVDVAAVDGVSNATGFERGLRLHLAETERLLVGLDSADATTRADLLAEVIEQNRLFERAAMLANEDRLARVLRSFDALLREMADESADPQSLRMQGEQLDFELSVMQTKLAQVPSKSTLQL